MLNELIEDLRDYDEVFIFQGGSQYACEIADEIEKLLRLRELIVEANDYNISPDWFRRVREALHES